MPLPLSSYLILACFAQRTRIPTSARSIGFCVIWVCISSSSSLRVPPEESSSSRHFQKSIRLRERESERNRQKEFQKVSTVVVQYKKKGRTPTNEPRTKFHLR